jgi:DNA-directed RNA polymerase subunit M/transcription elongation factor TFIIS
MTEIDREKAVKMFQTTFHSKKLCEKYEKIVYEKLSEAEMLTDYFWVIYQVVGMGCSGFSGIKEELREGNVGWKNTCYKETEMKLLEMDKYLDAPIEVVPGVTKCGSCGSNRTLSVAIQNRSQDEGTSTMNRCVDCGNTWMYSG